MTTSRNPSPSQSSSDRDLLDPLDTLAASFTDTSLATGRRPVGSRPRGSLPIGSTAAVPPRSTRSLPVASTADVLGGLSATGHTSGKNKLFRCGLTVDGIVCCGFIGGPSESKQRFYTKTKEPGCDHCGVLDHGRAKAPLTL